MSTRLHLPSPESPVQARGRLLPQRGKGVRQQILIVNNDADWVAAEGFARTFGDEFEFEASVSELGGIEFVEPLIFGVADMDFFVVDQEMHVGGSGGIFDPAREANDAAEFLLLDNGFGLEWVKIGGIFARNRDLNSSIGEETLVVGWLRKEVVLADDAAVEVKNFGILGDGVIVVFSMFEGEVIGIEIVDALDARIFSREGFVHSHDGFLCEIGCGCVFEC